MRKAPGPLYYDILETPLGWIGALASPDGLRRTTLPQRSPDECVRLLGPEIDKASELPERLASLRYRLCNYLSGTRLDFRNEPVDVHDASPFLRAAWQACRSIPPGETRTYAWLAAQVGTARASRAAGQSMARNRLPFIIPCHRVVASDGSLRGYGNGTARLDLKALLLKIESGDLKPNPPPAPVTQA